MTTARSTGLFPMSQKERDILKTMHPVLKGERTQAEAAGLLGISVRQVRRIQRRLEEGGDEALVHGLRGKPSNHRSDPKLRRGALAAYRARYKDFGPTLASEETLTVMDSGERASCGGTR